MAKKFKFNQNDLKDFFRDHVEKVIMGVAAVLLGWFLWNAISVKPTTTRTPSELQQLAASTKNFLAEDSWPQMAEYRKADTTAPDRIRAAAENVAQVDAYEIGMVAGPLVKDAELRRDPELLPAFELIARPMTVAIFHKVGEGKASPLLLQSENEKLFPDDRDQDKGKKGKDKDKEKDKEKDTKSPPKSMGETYEVIHSLDDWGVRGASVEKMVPSVETVITVVGLVPFENQWKRFDAALRRSRGYFPDRDRPTYLYLQIARQVEGEEWDENYEKAIADFEDKNFGSVQAPEIVDPKYYDNVLTRPFPPVTAFDFREVARHPKVPMRRTVPSFLWIKETGEQLVPFRGDKSGNKDRNKDEDDKSAEEQDDKKQKDPKREELERIKGSSKVAFDEAVASKTPLAPYRMIRFVDYDPPLDKSVRYRVRLWLLDSNDPPDSIDAIGKKSDRDKPTFGLGAEGDSEGPNSNSKKDAYRKQPVTAQMIHPSVAERLRQKLDTFDSLPDKALRNAIPTDWSPETEFVSAKTQIPSEVYLGAVRESATVAVGNVRIPRDEPTANVAASYTSPDFGVRVAAPKQANRGDLLNFSIPNLGIVNPSKRDVVKLRQTQVRSNLLLVDIQGGSELNLNDIREVKVQNENPNSVEGFESLHSKFTDPGEILVMDEDGKFRIQTTNADYRFYRSRLLLPDETLEHGKAPEKEDDKKGGRRGGAPPGGAGGGGGDVPGG
ncbi:MAG: hypothetical protein KF851_18570 [Pirellulaceae bacterium]|nr:hypothetical protein [Pirellulaceae bacterium]